MSTKEEARQKYLSLRKELSQETYKELCDQIAERFQDYYKQFEFNSVHLYLSIAENNEIDTQPLFEFLWDRKVTTISSVSDFRVKMMHSVYIYRETRLRPGPYNIPLPAGEVIPFEGYPEMVIVPLIAFDKKGYRVGYGQGFYDRFVATLPKETILCGLSLFDPVDELSDSQLHDLQLDACITPSQIYTFKG
ncbi:MAG: 5-formyltetrahydrofolate cyclo-ligase [Cyclobacteriaceae bacterium]|nr:5-formyltetrahydrofolate cyclo-ligase [Cyclobacteriaceae bacterium]MCH8515197.1 5-formyltetrahydrofolate cyclo-ligase [Cyclobacteriaceae bacterium]